MRSVSSFVALLSFLAAAARGAEPDCQHLPQAVKDQEDRYWKVYMGQILGDHLAEGEKLDDLTTKLRSCPPPGKAPKPAASSAPTASAAPPVSATGAAQASLSAGVPAAAAASSSSVAPVAVAAMVVPNASTPKPPPEAQPSVVGAPPRQEPPADEGAFCTIVRDFAQQYQSLSATDGNESKLAELRSERGEALRQALGTTRVSNWTATLTRPRTTGDGHAVVEVRLPCGVTLKTWNNLNSDVGSDTLVTYGSPLFTQIGKLHEEQQVVIDGQLFQGARDGFTELSFSEKASMLNPEFLFRFANVRTE